MNGTYGAIMQYVAKVAPDTNLYVIIVGTLLSICIASVLALKMRLTRA